MNTTAIRIAATCLPLALLGLTSACELEYIDDDLDVAVQEAGGGGQEGCGLKCGGNAHIGNDAVFNPIDPTGAVPSNNFRLDVASTPVYAENGVLYHGGGVPFQVGDFFRMFEEENGTIRGKYRIEVLEKEYISDLTVYQNRILVYRLGFWDEDDANQESPIPICERLSGDTQNHWALIVKGETYDPNTDAILQTGGAVADFFTTACYRGAISKMVRFGYNPELPVADPNFTTVQQRTDTLAMTMSRYCGDGHSFTQLGTSVGWENSPLSVDDVPAGAKVEAEWRNGRATCLSMPRLSDGTAASTDAVLAAVAARCPLPPPCDPSSNGWLVTSEWRSHWAP